MPPKQIVIWVIEMKVCKGLWEPTVGCGISRKSARHKMKDYWYANNPYDQFRVVKYIRASAAETVRRGK